MASPLFVRRGCVLLVGVDGGGAVRELHVAADIVGGAGLDIVQQRRHGARAVGVLLHALYGGVGLAGLHVDMLEAVVDVVAQGGVAGGVVYYAEAHGVAVEVGGDGDRQGGAVGGHNGENVYPVGVARAGRVVGGVGAYLAVDGLAVGSELQPSHNVVLCFCMEAADADFEIVRTGISFNHVVAQRGRAIVGGAPGDAAGVVGELPKVLVDATGDVRVDSNGVLGAVRKFGCPDAEVARVEVATAGVVAIGLGHVEADVASDVVAIHLQIAAMESAFGGSHGVDGEGELLVVGRNVDDVAIDDPGEVVVLGDIAVVHQTAAVLIEGELHVGRRHVLSVDGHHVHSPCANEKAAVMVAVVTVGRTLRFFCAGCKR